MTEQRTLDGQTIGEIVREYFPDADNRLVDFLLWSKTGYPAFWHLPDGKGGPEACLRSQLAREADRNRRGVTACYLCGADMPIRASQQECPDCGGSLTKACEILRSRNDRSGS